MQIIIKREQGGYINIEKYTLNTVTGERKRCYILIKDSIQEEDITITNFSTHNNRPSII